VPSELYELVQKAAAVEGLTLTDYLLVTLRHAAEASLERPHLIELSREDQAVFAKALLDPPPLSAALRRAMARRHELFGR
jgi:uncharacterized protein (DUF1778 family)